MKLSFKLLVFLFIGFNYSDLLAQEKANSQKYLGQKPPSSKPIIFAKDIVSKSDEFEFGSVFNADGTEFFYATHIGEGKERRAEIRVMKLENSKWTEAKAIVKHEKYWFNDPFLSFDEKRLYYISDMPRSQGSKTKDTDLWYSERTKDGWSDPIHLGNIINSDVQDYYVSFTTSGRLYFASHRDAEEGRTYDFDIYYADQKDGVFQKPQRLPKPANTRAYEADVFVAPDESYIIFSSFRKSGFGEGDLYISFKNKDGSWTEGKNMGETINTESYEFCPFVTRDGKYLFYTSKKDIYWVSAEVIKKLR